MREDRSTPNAVWNGVMLADSEDTIVVEGNHYFPPEALDREYFVESSHHTVCSWKGLASYYSIVVGDAANKDAAWYYADPPPGRSVTMSRSGRASRSSPQVPMWKRWGFENRGGDALSESVHDRTDN